MNLKELYFSPKGRINRQKYILSALGIGISTVIIAIILMVLGACLGETFSIITGIIVLITYALCAYTQIVLQVKRWHDLDKSGWFVLLGFIPIVGIIAMCFLLFVKGTDGNNNFGNDPLA